MIICIFENLIKIVACILVGVGVFFQEKWLGIIGCVLWVLLIFYHDKKYKDSELLKFIRKKGNQRGQQSKEK